MKYLRVYLQIQHEFTDGEDSLVPVLEQDTFITGIESTSSQKKHMRCSK
jgi:hypothetical protein